MNAGRREFLRLATALPIAGLVGCQAPGAPTGASDPAADGRSLGRPAPSHPSHDDVVVQNGRPDRITATVAATRVADGIEVLRRRIRLDANGSRALADVLSSGVRYRLSVSVPESGSAETQWEPDDQWSTVVVLVDEDGVSLEWNLPRVDDLVLTNRRTEAIDAALAAHRSDHRTGGFAVDVALAPGETVRYANVLPDGKRYVIELRVPAVGTASTTWRPERLDSRTLRFTVGAAGVDVRHGTA